MWQEAYLEFIRECYIGGLRPNYIMCWINHPVLPGHYIVDLSFLMPDWY